MTRHAVLFLALLPTGKATAPNCTATQDALVAYVAHVNALQEDVVTQSEIAAERRDYEASTGTCHRCLGEKRTIHGVSSTNGTTYRVCSRCMGIGLAPQLASAEVAK